MRSSRSRMDEIGLTEDADRTVIAIAVTEAYKVKGGPSHGPPESSVPVEHGRGWAPRLIRKHPGPKAERTCRQRTFSCCTSAERVVVMDGQCHNHSRRNPVKPFHVCLLLCVFVIAKKETGVNHDLYRKRDCRSALHAQTRRSNKDLRGLRGSIVRRLLGRAQRRKPPAQTLL